MARMEKGVGIYFVEPSTTRDADSVFSSGDKTKLENILRRPKLKLPTLCNWRCGKNSRANLSRRKFAKSGSSSAWQKLFPAAFSGQPRRTGPAHPILKAWEANPNPLPFRYPLTIMALPVLPSWQGNDGQRNGKKN